MSDINELDNRLAEKCNIYYGTYTGNGAASRTIELGGMPKAVLTMSLDGTSANPAQSRYYGGLALVGHPVKGGGNITVSIVENGFQVYRIDRMLGDSNTEGVTYYYLAFN